MGAMASQITSLTIVYPIVYSGTDQRKHQSSASLAFVRGIHRWPVNSPHKGPVTRKMFPFDDVIMSRYVLLYKCCTGISFFILGGLLWRNGSCGIWWLWDAYQLHRGSCRLQWGRFYFCKALNTSLPGPWFNIKRCLSSIGYTIMEIRWSNDHLISTMEFLYWQVSIFILNQPPGPEQL